MNQIHGVKDFYKKYSKGFGAEGRGVKYTYFIQNEKGEYTHYKDGWEVRQDDVLSELERHGLYYGSGSITVQGPLFEAQSGLGHYDFSYKPIDMADALGREHDMEEDNAHFVHWQHPQNIIADIRFVRRLQTFLAVAEKEGYIDPYTGKKPSEESLAATRNAIKLFTMEIERKKLELKLRLTTKDKSKKISMRLYTIIEDKIKNAETEEVMLPTPNPDAK
jgi:hypothetical protein